MRPLVSILLLILLSSRCFADTREAQVDAARVSAQARLAETISDQSLGNTTVGVFLARMDAQARLWEVLRNARQVGGERWLDHDTCQVRLEVDAGEIGKLLQDLHKSDADRSPLTTDQLQYTLKLWRGRTFSTTASSLTWTRAEDLSPPKSVTGWQKIDPQKRRSAIRAARENAGRRLASSALPVAPNGLTTDATTADDLAKWISTQPVTALEFRDDQSVQVELAVEPAELKRRLGGKPMGFARPIVRGEARVTAESDRIQTIIPINAPDWTMHQVESIGEAQFAGTPLKTARLAEHDAQQRLRDRINEFEFDGGRSVGVAAQLDPSIAAALDRLVSEARVERVEYRDGGSACVRVTLDGQMVWREICEAATKPINPVK